MRLLIVSDTFPPDVNGVARSLRQFALGLEAKGHHVEIVTTCEADDGGESFQRHVVVSLPFPGYSTLRVGFASPSWFVALFSRVRVDVLYVATETPLGIAAIWAARRVGLPVVSGFHTNFHTYLRDYHLIGLQPAVEAVLRTVHNHTARTLAPSLDTAKMLRDMGFTSVSVLGRGVDAELFNPEARSLALRAEWGADKDVPVALYVGRLAAEKNFPLLERAFEEFLLAQPHGRCVVVGDGPMAEDLRSRHPEWIFAGSRKGADLAHHYASSDVFIFPSTSETFGNVVIEALASGLVVVAYDYAAANEHIQDGQHGLLAPLNDEVAFLGKVRDAAWRWDDDALRIEARVKARSLSWARQIDVFENELIQAMQQPLPIATP
jgi:glycosyltransferase involved in cell wall biosynthesis